MSFSKGKKLIGLVVMLSLAGGVATVTATTVGPEGDRARTNIYAPTDLEVPKVGEHGNSDRRDEPATGTREEAMKQSILLIAMGLALAFAAGCGDPDTAEDGTILRTVDEMEP
jgi:hypothetical protein